MQGEKIVREDTNCYDGNPDGCEIVKSEVPSLAALDLRFCRTHTEVISYNRPHEVPGV